MYKVEYLPVAKRDLEEAVAYIASELANVDAALELLDEIESAVQNLREMPYRHALYASAYAMKNEIRYFPIKSYNVFYVVHEEQKTVEIRRVLYQRRNVRSL